MKAYQCKISIKDSKPLVWWRIFIPAGLSFSALSLLLEELTGEELGDGVQFEIHRDSLVWEPSESRPLDAGFYRDAYSAAHTPLSTLFEKSRPLYVRGADTALKIEVEKRDDTYPFSYPLLVKMRANMDGQALYDRMKSRFAIREEAGPALCRAELLNAGKDGALTLNCVEPKLVRGETYQPSGHTVLSEASSLLWRLVEDRPKSVWGMRSLLLSYSGNELQELAQDYGILDIEKKKREDLADELCPLLLDPEAVRKSFLLLSDDEIATFEKAAAAKDPYRLSEEESDRLDKLIDDSYVFIEEDWTTVNIPAELPELFNKINTPEFDKKRRQLNWIVRCLNDIVPPYYALMPLQKFCRLCRRTSDPQILPEEVPALLHEFPDGLTECVVTNDEVRSSDIDENQETCNFVISVQGDKPWRIMRENEISELLTYGYPPHDLSYRNFKTYLQKNFRLDEKQIKSITQRIHLLSAYCRNMKDFFKVFEFSHLKLTRKQIEELSKLFQNVINNTPTFYNRGFTPAQMADMR